MRSFGCAKRGERIRNPADAEALLSRFTERIPVEKGRSGDRKYRVSRNGGARFLLRLSDGAQRARKAMEYRMLETAFEAGVPVSAPVAFGDLPDGRVFQLTEWLEGRDLESLAPALPPDSARACGREAGRVLRALHGIPAPDSAPSWKTRFEGKIRARTDDALKADNDAAPLLTYLNSNLSLPEGRVQRFAHGDYNLGNLILSPGGALSAIDFNAYDSGFGDPLFELCPILMDSEAPQALKSGFMEAYFCGAPPPDFASIMTYYRAYCLLAELCECGDGAEEARARAAIRAFSRAELSETQFKI